MSLNADQGALAVTLHDAALHDELVLLVEMVATASESPVPLTRDQIDQVLFEARIVHQRAAE